MSLLKSLLTWIRAPRRKVKEVDARAAAKAREAGAVVLDVREGFEHRGSRIPGSLNVPLGELTSRLAEVPRDRPVVVHCAVGARGRVAAAILDEAGYGDVANLAGGIVAWKREGLEVEKDQRP
ncbi:MAG TPA: rhodanese-like domain-containing protein [Candidatus Thermoplasmatota archaeon]|nr:rhodanese-like domain-containing protein [Candidatus Thermoplasmatota archaeon]